MTDFRDGDRVVVINEGSCFAGSEGVVARGLRPERRLINVQLPDDNAELGFHVSELALIAPSPSPFDVLTEILEGRFDELMEGEVIGLGAPVGSIAVLVDYEDRTAQAVKLSLANTVSGVWWRDMATEGLVGTIEVLKASAEGRAFLVYTPGGLDHDLTEALEGLSA